MVKKQSQRNRFTHPIDSLAATIEDRIRELLNEGVSLSTIERYKLKDEEFDFEDKDFRGYPDGIELGVDNPETTDAQGYMGGDFYRFLIIPSDDRRDVIEYYIRQDLSS